MNWRKKSEHCGVFEDGEQFLVAVPIYDIDCKPQYWALDVVTVFCDGERFGVDKGGNPWDWDWSHVAYYVPIEEAREGLPSLPALTPGEPSES
ncbi:MAG: hypothetical protein ABSG53_19910 [Thermoguttaceae bacterium]